MHPLHAEAALSPPGPLGVIKREAARLGLQPHTTRK